MVMPGNGSAVLEDLSVNVAGRFHLLFSLHIASRWVPISARSTSFTVHPLLKLLAVGDAMATSPTRINLTRALDVYGLVRIPALSLASIPQGTPTRTPFELGWSASSGAKIVAPAAPASVRIGSLPLVLPEFDVDARGEVSFALQLSITGAPCTEAWWANELVSTCINISVRVLANEVEPPQCRCAQGNETSTTT